MVRRSSPQQSSLFWSALLVACAGAELPTAELDQVVVEPSLTPLDAQPPPRVLREQGVPLAKERGVPEQGAPRDALLPLDQRELPADREIDQVVEQAVDQTVDQAVDQEPACVPAEESPDGLDNDCDTRIDEGSALPCPRVEFAEKSYFFCDPDELSWGDAKRECERWGYYLFIIESAEEQRFIAEERDRQSQENLWIGLNDRDQEGRFIWIDGSEPGFTRWDDGEPNDGGRGEDCTAILRENGRVGRWDDRSCGRLYDYTCESP
ncbi:MAG: C-type lectin domain-containing protein [Myxococcota bacterium]|nr:C-type lectin domain-containing protein [Myxococcota bacterium]